MNNTLLTLVADIFNYLDQNQAPQKRYKVTKLQSYKNTNRGIGEWAEKMRDEFLIIYIIYIIYIINYYNIINKLPN